MQAKAEDIVSVYGVEKDEQRDSVDRNFKGTTSFFKTAFNGLNTLAGPLYHAFLSDLRSYMFKTKKICKFCFRGWDYVDFICLIIWGMVKLDTTSSHCKCDLLHRLIDQTMHGSRPKDNKLS